VDTRLQQAITLREQGEGEKALAILQRLLEEQPNHPEYLYQCAWTHDVLGLERAAVPYYEQAIRAGLQGEDLRGALLGLGSTFRTLGEYARSEEVLRAGMQQFPEGREFPVFLAMTLFNLERHEEAMRLLLVQLAETTQDEGIAQYRRAIRYYADRLRETWD